MHHKRQQFGAHDFDLIFRKIVLVHLKGKLYAIFYNNIKCLTVVVVFLFIIKLPEEYRKLAFDANDVL